MQKKKRLEISKKIKISSMARTILILFAIAIFSFGLGMLIKALTAKKEILPESKEIYTYTNKCKIKSDVNLIDNEYIKEDEITEEQTYLSDIISDIDLGFDYNYLGSKEEDITYNYKIEAILSSKYNTNNKSYDILNKVETLNQSEDKQINDKGFAIKEDFKINYTKYHQMIKRFKQEMGISIDSSLEIKLIVNTKTKVESREIKNEYVSNYKITLGDKISLIEYKDQDEKSDSIKYNVASNYTREIKTKDAAIGAIIMLIGLYLIILIVKKTETLKIIGNEFKLELNRIMKSCESKIVEIEDLNHIDISTATKVKDISQLLKLSDEALVPIYCYVKEEPEQEAYFIVVKYEKCYIFILK